MSGRIQPFDTTGFRLIKPGFGDTETLASLYATGLADPTNDNLFATPAGNLRFPGNVSWGAQHWASEVAFFQEAADIDMSSPPAYELISMAARLSGVGGGGGGIFRTLELNDPAWDGSFAGLGGTTPWYAEVVTFSRDPAQTSAHAATEYARRTYWSFGRSPINYPNVSRPGLAMVDEMALFNSSLGHDAVVERQTGYGQSELLLYNIEPGVCGQWVTHWNNNALSPAAGDGPGWIIDIDGRFDAFTGGAALQAYQRDANPALGWGWRLFGLNAAGTVLAEILDVNSDGSTLNNIEVISDASKTVGVCQGFKTPTFSLLATGFTDFAMPLRAGKTFVPVAARLIVETRDAALTTFPSFTLAQNNVAVSTLVTTIATQFNTYAAPSALQLTGVVNINANLDLTALPLQIQVQAAAAGAGLTTMDAHVELMGYYR